MTPEEKRLAQAMAGGSGNSGLPTNTNNSGKGWAPTAPGGSSGGVGGASVGAIIGGAGTGTVTGTGGRRDYFTIGNIGSVLRTSPVATQGGGMGG